MRIPVILTVAALGLFTLAARADTFQTFDLTANFAGAGTITGTINLDLSSTSSHNLSDSEANLTYTDGGTTVQFTGYNSGLGYTSSPSTVELNFYDSLYTYEFELVLPVSSLASFNGGLCTSSPDNCSSYVSSISFLPSHYGYTVYTGSFTPEVTATPEPASVLLLGTGLLGLAESTRRRMRRAV